MIVETLKEHMEDGVRLKQIAQRDFIRAMRTGRMMAFVGSMTGREFDYDSWGGFLEKAVPHDLQGEYFEQTNLFSSVPEIQARFFYNPTVNSAFSELTVKGGDPLLALDLLNIASTEDKEERFRRYEGLFGVETGEKRTPDKNAIWQICRNLGIRRIITTNYDMEFEFELMGNPQLVNGDQRKDLRRAMAMKWASERADMRALKIGPDGEPQRLDYRMKHVTADSRKVLSDCFHRERADRLFEFAVGASDRAWHILHLHGRVTDPETMIVTYSDYERQYRTRGITKLPFEHGMNLLYAGNPILFIGLGMSENDVLGALRTFVGAGYPSQLAPHFVLWSPEQANGRTVSAKDELRRLKFYRQYGVHLLYDVEIAADDADVADLIACKKERRLSESISALARFAAERVLPFEWEDGKWNDVSQESKGGDFRDVQRLLELPSPENGAVGQATIWEILPKSEPPTLPSCPDVADVCAHRAPIKAFIDPPGSGHGYAARFIKQHFSASVEKMRYLQLNAAFSWELDTTFATVSGMADGTSAYRKRKSRLRVARELVEQIVRGRFSGARLCIVINGADRFFDPTGYPLSNELDQLIRMIISLPNDSQTYGPVRPSPVTLMLFGTARVERYLLALHKDDSHPVRDGIMPARPPWLAQWSVRIAGEGTNAYPVFHNVEDTPDHPARVWDESTLDREEQRLRLPALRSVYFNQVKNGSDALKWDGAERSITWAEHTAVRQSLVAPEVDLRKSFLTVILDPNNLAQALGLEGKQSPRRVRLALRILRVMAFIGQPVDVDVLTTAVKASSQEYAKRERHSPKERFFKKSVGYVLGRLHEAEIVMKFKPFPGAESQELRYGLHRAVLHEIRDRNSVPFSDARNYTSFNIPLATAQPIDDHEPEVAVQEEIEAIIDALIKQTAKAVETAKVETVDRDAMNSISRYLRTACATLRSYYTTSTLLMHTPKAFPSEKKSPKLLYHAERLGRLIYVAEEHTKLWRAWEAKAGADTSHDLAGTFLPDDLVWLHAQRGVALMTQGDIYGARDSLGKATVINNRFVEFGDMSQNWRRIELNQIHIDIERGKLSTAEARIRGIKGAINALVPDANWKKSWLEQTGDKYPQNAFEAIMQAFGMQQRARVRAVSPHFASDLILTVGLACGYRGWCEYLRGRLRTAEHYFNVCIQILRNTGEQRAYALFMRHYASLLNALGMKPEARDAMNLCLAAAESTRQFDISHLASINKADHDIETGERVDRVAILRQLLATLRYAVLTDMYRVQMEARRVLARMRLQDGDFDGALEQASEAIAIATRFGFSLRKIDLRILMGQILRRRGDPVSGDAMFKEAGSIADRIGYQRAVEKVHHAQLHPRKNLF